MIASPHTELVERLRATRPVYSQTDGQLIYHVFENRDGKEAAEAIECLTAALASARNDALEEAAKVAGGWLESSWVDEVFAARSIADAIRSLKTEGGE